MFARPQLTIEKSALETSNVDSIQDGAPNPKNAPEVEL